jgi:hypothetical protein
VQRGESRILSHNGHVPDIKKRPANIPEIGISARNNVPIVMKGLHLDRYQTLAGAQLCSHFAKKRGQYIVRDDHDAGTTAWPQLGRIVIVHTF